MLRIFRRHTPACSAKRPQHDREYRRCNCVISCEGKIGDEYVRESLKTRDWNAAWKRVSDAEARGRWSETAAGEGKTLAEAIEMFLADCQSETGRNLRQATYRNYVTLCTRLEEFATRRKVKRLVDVTPELLRNFRDSWKNMGLRSISNSVCRLRSMFRFFLESEWIEKNPALLVRPPKVAGKEKRKEPFSELEMAAILKSAKELYGENSDAEALILLMRHSGLRISDAAFLRKEQLQPGAIEVTTTKTRSHVVIPVPDWLIERLSAIEPKQDGGYLFASGSLRLNTVTDLWRRRLHRAFKHAGVTGKTVHCLRHTYATDLISRGVPIDLVSRLLTHSSITITERVYFHHQARNQARMEGEVRKAWSHDDEYKAA